MSSNRRSFLKSALLGMSSAALPCTAIAANLKKRPRILLRGSWLSINIGDIAHTLGTINLIKTYLPEVGIILWPKNVRDGGREMILRRFPNLRIIQKDHEVQSAFHECAFVLHSSGPVFVGQDERLRWRKETDKP